MILKRKDVIIFKEQKRIITLVLKNGRNYTGNIIYISEENFDNDCIIEMLDKNNKSVTFKLSHIEVVEKLPIN